MRTEYELWSRPGSGEDPRWEPAGRHQTIEDAMAAAGLPDPSACAQHDAECTTCQEAT